MHGWHTVEVCHPCTPYALGFGDSLHQFIPVNGNDGKPHVMYTLDGGDTWTMSAQPAAYFYGAGGFEFTSFFPPSTYYSFSTKFLFVSTNGGQSWDARSPSAGNTILGTMFDQSSGCRVSITGNSVKLHDTRDSGHSFLDEISHWGGQPGLMNAIDSTRLWKGGYKYLYRTWDRGITWDTIMPFDLSTNPTYYFLLRTTDSNRVYVIGGPGDAYDYITTRDGGHTWEKPIAVAGGRITRIAEQSPDSLWLLVNRRSMPPRPNQFNLDQATDSLFADTLYYTQDGGKTWLKDLTFVGDTITDLIFRGPQEGYVVSTRDSTVRFSRYVSSPSSVDGKAYGYESGDLRIYPNPVSNEMQFYPKLGGECRVRILDVLGRCVDERDINLIHMQATRLAIPDRLSDGLYFLELVRGDARAVQRFILRR